jgi:hypothetical protein
MSGIYWIILHFVGIQTYRRIIEMQQIMSRVKINVRENRRENEE